jgi:hypothetical protein
MLPPWNIACFGFAVNYSCHRYRQIDTTVALNDSLRHGINATRFKVYLMRFISGSNNAVCEYFKSEPLFTNEGNRVLCKY